MATDIKQILPENRKRRKALTSGYDPITGNPDDSGRQPVNYGNTQLWIPREMFSNSPVTRQLCTTSPDSLIARYTGNVTEEKRHSFICGFIRERFRYDFEFWASACIKIQDKETKQPVPFRLNNGQRKLLTALENSRINDRPIRIILVKARQWGGSTLSQIYMLWLQLFHYRNWHSVVITDVEQQARNVRGMISRVAASYPPECGSITFTPFEGSSKIRTICERGCIIGVGSSQEPDALRSFDFSMIHMSEVGIWKSTPTRSAEDIVQSLYATVPDVPGSLIIVESTAKGVGNFFHLEYQTAKSGTSQYTPVFVSWFEIPRYQLPVKDYEAFISGMSSYNWWQWEQGATLEGIHWYNTYKLEKRYNDFQMKSEFPTTDDEAFQSTGNRFYDQQYTMLARKQCKPPRQTGELRGQSVTGPGSLRETEFIENGNSRLCIWQQPESLPRTKITNRYLVVTDIGGRSEKSDWSVITVIDRYWMLGSAGVPEVVARWRGRTDHDALAWKAAQIATWYDNALLVIESNTLETRDRKQDGDHFYTVLNEIAEHYDNLYTRTLTNPDAVIEGDPVRYGWHMNKKTKTQAYDKHYQCVRDGLFIDRDHRAIDEMEYLEYKSDGSLGAITGQHDDIIDTDAVGCYIAWEEMDRPREINTEKTQTGIPCHPVTESNF